MSINALGVAAYTKTEMIKPFQGQNTSQKVNESQVAATNAANAEDAKQADQMDKIRAPRREDETSSALAVRSKLESGLFAEVMTPEEREALAVLFEKYQDNLDQKASYGATGRESDGARLGSRVDYRV